MSQVEINKTSLEDSLVKLEQIVSELESGELPLEDSLKKFEEGVKLYKNCKGILGNVEKRIKILTDSLKEEEMPE